MAVMVIVIFMVVLVLLVLVAVLMVMLTLPVSKIHMTEIRVEQFETWKGSI